ncbi:MAG: HPr family phosphocarrier protein [Anaerolineae bacterium]
MPKTTLVVNHPLGLHARPAALFVQTAALFDSRISVSNLTNGEGPVDAKSIVGVLTLAVTRDSTIEIDAVGVDEEEALLALTNLVQDIFGE